jgi:hypothetical protein
MIKICKYSKIDMSYDNLLGLSTETDIYNTYSMEFDDKFIQIFKLNDFSSEDVQNMQSSYYYILIRKIYSILRDSEDNDKMEGGGLVIHQIIFGLLFMIMFNNIAYAMQHTSAISKHRPLSYISKQPIDTLIKPNIGNVSKFMEEFHSHIPPLNDVKSFVSVSNKFISVAENFITTSDVKKTMKLFFDNIFFPNAKKVMRNHMYSITCNFILETIPYQEVAPLVKPAVFIVKKRKDIVKLVDYLKNIQNHIQYVLSLLQKICRKMGIDEKNIYKIGIYVKNDNNYKKITAGKKRKSMKLRKKTHKKYYHTAQI